MRLRYKVKPFSFAVYPLCAFFFLVSAVYGVSDEVDSPPVGAGVLAPWPPERTMIPLVPPAFGSPQVQSKTTDAIQVKIVPKMPDPGSKKTYRAQLGSFSSTEMAWRCFDRLEAAGLNPKFELHGGMYRVVIPGLPAADISELARRLADVAFTEVWIREEN